MRGAVSVLAAVLAAAALGSTTLAAGRPNPNRGKSVFKATCKACHAKAGDAKDLTPISKTQAQWQREFKRGLACSKKVEAKTGKVLTPQDLADMELFLVSHAADSDQPETCGS